VPVVVSVQGEDLFLGQLEEPWRGRTLELLAERAREADAFVAPSRFYANVMRELLGVDDERMRVVSLGIRLHSEEKGLEGEGVVSEGGREGDRTVVGYLARICPEKGFHHLVEAFEELAMRPGGERLHLHVAGYLGPADRPYFEKLEERLQTRGLGERFRYLGEVDLEQKRAFLRSLDLFSVPTVYQEAKGLSILEAMAEGVPVVQPNHGSFPEILEKTGGGLLVEPDSPAALAEALARLLANPAYRDQLGKSGQAGVREHYNTEVMARRTVDLYQELAAPVLS